jgi:hypothetical protein
METSLAYNVSTMKTRNLLSIGALKVKWYCRKDPQYQEKTRVSELERVNPLTIMIIKIEGKEVTTESL